MNPEGDSIVADIRAIRSELAARFGSDINALCDFLAENEHDHEELLVNYQPNSPHVIALKAEGG